MTRNLWIAAILLLPITAREPLAKRIVHSDPSQFQPQKAVHGGPGQLDGVIMLDAHALETNLSLLHRAVIEPKSGVGAHFHNTCEEMFVIFDGEAQFTIDGRTSVVKAPAGVLCRAGHSHAIYNATDKPVQWLNIQVTAVKGSSDHFDLDDPRVGVPLDAIPAFMTTHFDRALLHPVEAMSDGKGTVQYRRAMEASMFTTPWSYVDHLVLPPAASVGSHMHKTVGEVYYVVKGRGTVTVSAQNNEAETSPIHEGDAIPLQLGEVHSFANNGIEPLELLVIGVSRDTSHVTDSVDRPHFSGPRN